MPKNRGYERGVGGHDLALQGPTGKGGNQGVREDGIQAGASGKNMLNPGTVPGTTLNNYGAGVLTKGNIVPGTPGEKDPGTGGGGVGNQLSALQGPGHDTEKAFTEWNRP